MKIHCFEELEIWQEARELCKVIFEITSVEPFSKDYKFRDQIRDASGSIMDNIAEGFGRGGNKEFINFLSIAKASNEETRSQSYRAFDYEYISDHQLNDLLEKTKRISRKTTVLIQYLRKSSIPGSKFPHKPQT
jgi:four helix bundle protein